MPDMKTTVTPTLKRNSTDENVLMIGKRKINVIIAQRIKVKFSSLLSFFMMRSVTLSVLYGITPLPSNLVDNLLKDLHRCRVGEGLVIYNEGKDNKGTVFSLDVSRKSLYPFHGSGFCIDHSLQGF